MIEGTLSGDTRVILRLESMSGRVRQAITDAMRRLWFQVQANVVTRKLSGDPLHRRTGNLASSINVDSEFEERPDEIVGRVGTKVRYGRVHEEGGTFEIPEHTRHITQAFGRPITPRDVLVAAHAVTYPQRSFLRSTLRDMSSQIKDDIAAAARAATEA